MQQHATRNETLLKGVTRHGRLADLNHWVSPRQGLHRSPAALRLVVGSVVGLGLHLDLQAVRAGAGRQLPVQGWQGWAAGEVRTCSACQLKKAGRELIIAALVKVKCAECERGCKPDLVMNLLKKTKQTTFTSEDSQHV